MIGPKSDWFTFKELAYLLIRTDFPSFAIILVMEAPSDYFCSQALNFEM